MHLLFVADALESFKIYKDTTFAMMREAQRRGEHGDQHQAGRQQDRSRRSQEDRLAALLAALGAGACLDQLCERLRQSPKRLSERLLQLELAGLVRGEPGLWWRPSGQTPSLP